MNRAVRNVRAADRPPPASRRLCAIPETPASVVPDAAAPGQTLSDASSADSSAASSFAAGSTVTSSPSAAGAGGGKGVRPSSHREAPSAASAAPLPLRLRAALLDAFTAHASFGARRDELRGLRMRGGQFSRLALAALEKASWIQPRGEHKGELGNERGACGRGSEHRAPLVAPPPRSLVLPPAPAAVDLAFSRAAPDALARGISFGAFLKALAALADELGADPVELATVVAAVPSPERIARRREAEREAAERAERMRQASIAATHGRFASGRGATAGARASGKENAHGGGHERDALCGPAGPASPGLAVSPGKKAWNAGLAPLKYSHLSSLSPGASESAAKAAWRREDRGNDRAEPRTRIPLVPKSSNERQDVRGLRIGISSGMPASSSSLPPMLPPPQRTSRRTATGADQDTVPSFYRPLPGDSSRPNMASPEPSPSPLDQGRDDTADFVASEVERSHLSHGAASPTPSANGRSAPFGRVSVRRSGPAPPCVSSAPRAPPSPVTWLQTTSLEADELGEYVQHALALSPAQDTSNRRIGAPASPASSYASCPSPAAPSVSIWLPEGTDDRRSALGA